MNITELARQVNMPTEKLRDLLPQLGFDVGRKAIKVDDVVASEIVVKINAYRKKEEQEAKNATLTANDSVHKEPITEDRVLAIGDMIIVKDLAQKMNLPITRLVLELMKNGVMASLNDHIDYETAAIIANDLGWQVTRDVGDENIDWEKIKEEREKYFKDDQKKLKPRPPVVVIMGHVDHGKTKLLDAIRETNVVAQEAGGITQHIGAYQVEKNSQLITFIDTPGHEAFSAMRSRGAQVADLAILVVAADDGVQPQTVEAVSHIRSAGLPLVVAINKVDKPDINIDKIKSELADIGLTPEDWGGKTICVKVSAKDKTNIDGLLETLLLVYEMEKDKIQGNPDRAAVGTIIEARVDKGAGPVATCLVQTGTLNAGDVIRIGSTVSKVRALKNWRGEVVAAAGPSMPVLIVGLKTVPQVGDILCEVSDKKEIRRLGKISEQQKYKLIYNEPNNPITKTKKEEDVETDIKKINIILKADFFGSVEAILEALQKVQYKKVKVEVIKKGLGNINESDVEEAMNLNAFLIGFHVKIAPSATISAANNKTMVRLFDVIYDLINFVKEQAEELVVPEIIIKHLGKAKVLKIFMTEKNYQVLGAKILDGKIIANAEVNVFHNDQLVASGQVAELRCGRQIVTEAVIDEECGLKIKGLKNIQAGDILEFYQQEKK